MLVTKEMLGTHSLTLFSTHSLSSKIQRNSFRLFFIFFYFWGGGGVETRTKVKKINKTAIKIFHSICEVLLWQDNFGPIHQLTAAEQDIMHMSKSNLYNKLTSGLKKIVFILVILAALVSLNLGKHHKRYTISFSDL